MPKKTETITLRLPAALRAQVEEYAQKIDEPVSVVVRQALEAFLKEEKHRAG